MSICCKTAKLPVTVRTLHSFIKRAESIRAYLGAILLAWILTFSLFHKSPEFSLAYKLVLAHKLGQSDLGLSQRLSFLTRYLFELLIHFFLFLLPVLLINVELLTISYMLLIRSASLFKLAHTKSGLLLWELLWREFLLIKRMSRHFPRVNATEGRAFVNLLISRGYEKLSIEHILLRLSFKSPVSYFVIISGIRNLV